jgi:phosphatidylethanolamine/phosphatidyl-N-methylethanolamine N-methyltransferase
MKAKIKDPYINYGKPYERFFYKTKLINIFMSINHFLLDIGVSDKQNKKIVEIGGGPKAHIEFFSKKQVKFVDSYIIIDDKKYRNNISILKKKYADVKFEFIDFNNHSKIKKIRNCTRLISSHTYEHILNFEDVFIDHLKLLKPEAIISIALPCDPGFFWSILQNIAYPFQKFIFGWRSRKEKRLSEARDHVNPIQNIVKIINYYFQKKKTIYFPLILPVVDLNFIYVAQLKKKNFNL